MKRILALAATLALAPLLRAEEPAPLTLKNSVALPSVEGRFDHAAVDSATHRLFFAALGNNTLEVVDVNAGKHLHSIAGLKKPTGVLFLADMNLLAVTSGDVAGVAKFALQDFSIGVAATE